MFFFGILKALRVLGDLKKKDLWNSESVAGERQEEGVQGMEARTNANPISGLILTRRPGERIILKIPGRDDIIVELKEIYAGRVRLRVVANKDVLILREELLVERGESE